jgi:class 3 adenylate cyclase
MDSRLTTDELVARTGETADRLLRWRELGLLARDVEGTDWRADDFDRVRLIQYAERRGVVADEIAAARETQGDVLGRYVTMSRGPRTRRITALDSAARRADLDQRVALRVWSAAGRRDEPDLDDDDVATLRNVRSALATGLPEEAVLQLVRVYADALGRVAEAECRLFHYYVHDRLKSEGLAGAELVAATDAAAERLFAMIEPAIVYFHRKAWARALRDDMILHLVDEGGAAPSSAPGEEQISILFVDLAQFTPLTEVMGDATAAEVVDRFSDIVRDAASRHEGRVLKQIGDAFMLVFRDAAEAVACALETDRLAALEHEFPALRFGVHSGRALYREGDYVGASVNVAARVLDAAERHQVLVTAAVRDQASDVSELTFRLLEVRALKGMAEPVELYEVQRSTERPARAVDPVCGMQLDVGRARARLRWHDRELMFCSDNCLRQFVATPERYRIGS